MIDLQQHPCSKTGGWHREDCAAVSAFYRSAMN
jgi:hypothetical protein